MNSISTNPRRAPAGPNGLPRTTYLLTLCQAINLTAAVVSVTIAALVGGKLAPNAAWATIPYGFQFAAVAVTTYPAASFMRRYGRRKGFLLGAAFLIAAGCFGYSAVARGSFNGLIAAHGLLGMYVAFANFYRFAAVDGLATELRSKGVSLVVAGGIVAAISGPLLSIGLKDVGGFASFSLCYASFVLLGLGTVVAVLLWRPENSAPGSAHVPQANSASSAGFLASAVIASALSYLVMNLLMVQASLLMESMCVSFDTSSFAIQGHVVAMFAPSFVTGVILSRVGHRHVLLTGYLLLAGSAVLGIWGAGLSAVVCGLIMLGVGWNFSYVGGGALLACTLNDANRHRMQGINDSIIAVSATIGAMSPGFLQSVMGWQNTNLLCLALCAIAAFATWVWMRERTPRPAEVPQS